MGTTTFQCGKSAENRYQETFIVLVEACGVLRELFGLGKSINRLPKSCPPLMQCRQLQQQLVEMSCDKTSQNFFFGSSKRSAEISILREEAFLITFFSSLKMHCCPTLEAGFSIHSSYIEQSFLIWDKDKNLHNLFENTLWNLTRKIFLILIYRWINFTIHKQLRNVSEMHVRSVSICFADVD